MKQYLTRLYSLAVLVAAIAVISGCKDTIPDPGYVDFGEVRIMSFVKCTPLKIEMIPAGTHDTTRLTPTALSFGVSTPYVNNLPTGRGSGQDYLFIARLADGRAVATRTIKLMPGDKYTWAIFDVDKDVPDQTHILQKDNPPANAQNPSKAYFRFFNTLPQYTSMRMRIGDALHGEEITLNGSVDIPFKQFSEYHAIDTLTDTTVTFFILDNSDNVVARLAGVSLEAGSYHTLTFNGYGPADMNCRKHDPITNQLTNEDTLRVHIYDDNSGGNDQLPVPSTLRFNIINAMIPADPALNLTNPYQGGGGVSYIVNNNTAYDFKDVQMYQGVPTYTGNFSADSVQRVYPKAVPYTGAYFKAVKATGKAPSGNDPVLMKFFANTAVITSDQLVSIVVFDAVQKPNTKAAPYDSAAGVMTIVVPDAPDPNKAIVVVGAAAWQAYKTSGTASWSLSRSSTADGDVAFTKIKKEKQTDQDLISANTPVTYKGTIKVGTAVTYDIPPFTFTPDPGGIYEVLVVGKINDPNGNKPRFIVVKTNPTL